MCQLWKPNWKPSVYQVWLSSGPARSFDYVRHLKRRKSGLFNSEVDYSSGMQFHIQIPLSRGTLCISLHLVMFSQKLHVVIVTSGLYWVWSRQIVLSTLWCDGEDSPTSTSNRTAMFWVWCSSERHNCPFWREGLSWGAVELARGIWQGESGWLYIVFGVKFKGKTCEWTNVQCTTDWS